MWLLLAAFAGVLSAAPAHAQGLMCPATIDTKQELAAAQSGWQPFVARDPHHLDEVTIYDGHPSGMASLVPDREIKRAGKPVNIWNFSQTPAFRIWLQCTYRGTSVTLIRQLDQSLKTCEVTYVPGPGGRGIDGVADVQCR
jgi:hypothetical protein